MNVTWYRNSDQMNDMNCWTGAKHCSCKTDVKVSNTLFEWVLFLYLNCKIIRSLINNIELIFSIWLQLRNAVFEWLVIWRERNLLKKPYIKGILHVERRLEGVRLCAFPFLRKTRTQCSKHDISWGGCTILYPTKTE